MRLLSALSTCLLLLATSCGGSEVGANAALDSGYTALNSNDPVTALEHFETALAELTPADPNYLGAKLGQMKAMAYIDPAKTKATLLAVPKDAGVTAKDFRDIVTDLKDAAKVQHQSGDKDASGASLVEAIAILKEGKTIFPEYDKWDALVQECGDFANAIGNDSATESLKGLGYTGDD